MRPSQHAAWRGVIAGVLTSFAAASPSIAQPPTVEAVHVRVRLLEEGRDAFVTARYQLRAGGDADTLRLTAIPFFGLRPAAITAMLDGTAVQVQGGFDPDSDGARVVLRAGDVELELRYAVPGAALARNGGIDLRVPLVLPVASATEAGDDFFRVELSARPPLAVTESFPSVAPLAGMPPEVLHAMRLPAAPSLLRWRLSSEPGRVTFAQSVDLALAALLVILGLLGVRALQRPEPRD